MFEAQALKRLRLEKVFIEVYIDNRSIEMSLYKNRIIWFSIIVLGLHLRIGLTVMLKTVGGAGEADG